MISSSSMRQMRFSRWFTLFIQRQGHNESRQGIGRLCADAPTQLSHNLVADPEAEAVALLREGAERLEQMRTVIRGKNGPVVLDDQGQLVTAPFRPDHDMPMLSRGLNGVEDKIDQQLPHRRG